ncbi:MAG: DNA-3-methyladenine glycosylase [Gemmatimonadota bacterium]|nr:DNA-3-methyladenine glycosylase [Gemmatimonadota bacterium]
MSAPDGVRTFCTRGPLELARALLGCRLVSTLGGVEVSGTIVETEAYGGPEDPASHACTVSGVTDRNRAMFGPAGYAYVYRSYGVHWCLNVVSGPDGVPGAVLLRGIEPVSGIDVMRGRRSGRRPLSAGPGRLCEALGVTGELYGHDLGRPPLRLHPGAPVAAARVGVSGRVGVREAADWPHRLYVRGAVGVSRPDGWDPVAANSKRRTPE